MHPRSSVLCNLQEADGRLRLRLNVRRKPLFFLHKDDDPLLPICFYIIANVSPKSILVHLSLISDCCQVLKCHTNVINFLGDL